MLLLSDSDQVTTYYIEACQTLRIGIGNLLRGGRGSKDSGALKERMAENLGIGESRVAKYLKDHCAVRWLTSWMRERRTWLRSLCYCGVATGLSTNSG